MEREEPTVSWAGQVIDAASYLYNLDFFRGSQGMSLKPQKTSGKQKALEQSFPSFKSYSSLEREQKRLVDPSIKPRSLTTTPTKQLASPVASKSIQTAPRPGSLPRTSPAPRNPLYYIKTLTLSVLLLLLLAGTCCIAYGIQLDIRNRIDLKVKDLSIEIGKCTRAHVDNKCHVETRVPILEDYCNNLEKCMNQQPYTVALTQVAATLLGETINNLVDPLSWRTMAVLLVVFMGCEVCRVVMVVLKQVKGEEKPQKIS